MSCSTTIAAAAAQLGTPGILEAKLRLAFAMQAAAVADTVSEEDFVQGVSDAEATGQV